MASRIQGITVEIGGDTTKLQTALKGVNGQSKSTQSQLKDVEKLLKLDPGNTELIAQKHKLLGEAVSETKEKLASLKTAAEQAFTVTDYSSNSLEGTVDASDNQTLFLSIPYDSGWKVKVDGKEVKTCRIGDAFLGVKVPSGEHTVSLKYTPPGFSIGWKVSLAAAIIFIVLCFVKYRYKADIKKKE